MTRPTVLLFDIDGTLVTTGGAGRLALERAMAEHLGRPVETLPFSFAGMTDRAIVRRGLGCLAAPVTDDTIDRLLVSYVDVLADEVARAEVYRVHPGVHAVLEAAKGQPVCAVGLGTGNIEAGARAKLARVDLNRYFAFGGFGCDSEDRPELLAAGAERGAAALGVDRAACRVVIVGDTPLDVAGARAIGAEVVAVATGGANEAALEASSPDHLFSDLACEGALAAVLHGLRH